MSSSFDLSAFEPLTHPMEIENPDPEDDLPPPPLSYFQEEKKETFSSQITILPSQLIPEIFRIPNKHGVFDKFSFEGRNHLPQIYDSPAKKILLCCARQVEKCVSLTTLVYTSKGLKRASEVGVGEEVVSLDKSFSQTIWARVVGVLFTEEKPAVKIEATGGELVCGVEHPIWTWEGWKKAGDLKKGMWVGRLRKMPEGRRHFRPGPGEEGVVNEIVLAAVAMAGTPAARGFQVTVKAPEMVERIQYALLASGGSCQVLRRTPSAHPSLYLSGIPKTRILSTHQRQKLPSFLMPMGPEAMRLFLQVYWGCSGSIVPKKGSMEARLYEQNLDWVRELAAAHLFLGIPTQITPFQKNQKTFYQLRPLRGGREKLASFLPPSMQKIFTLPPTPDEEEGWVPFKKDLREIWNARIKYPGDPTRWWAAISRSSQGSFSRAEAKEIFATLASVKGINLQKLQSLQNHSLGDVSWCQVQRVTSLPPQPMVDFQVDSPSKAFLADGFFTHNSTFLGNSLLLMSLVIPGYKSMYVSPSNVQTKTFSKDRLKNPIETSPILKQLADQGTQNVHEYVFGNHSQISLRSAFLSADRTRGVSVYRLCCDEFQDLLPEHLPVILPSLSHAPEVYRSILFTGTPKSFDNNMEYYRSGFNRYRPMSTMGEWMVPCDRCGSSSGAGRYWQCLGEANIERKGLSCSRCHQLLNPQHPDALWVHHQADGEFESYRIPQLMVPWRPWADIFNDYVNFPKAQFYNEVLGLSMDDSSRPLTMSEMRACCDPRLSLSTASRFLPQNWNEPIFAGIDWGSGTSSYTVLTLATYIGGIFSVFYIHRFTGLLLDVEEQIQHILQELRRYNVEIVGTDFGFGLQYNDTLIRRFGHNKVAVFQHLGKVTKKVWFDAKVNRFKVFRSLVMADFINMIKRKNIRFPCWEDFREPYAKDFCNITSHLNETQQMVIYSHRQDRPDDSFHSVLYAFLASYLRIPRPDIIKPLHNYYNQGPVFGLQNPQNQG